MAQFLHGKEGSHLKQDFLEAIFFLGAFDAPKGDFCLKVMLHTGCRGHVAWSIPGRSEVRLR
jgi:hypothetical protein